MGNRVDITVTGTNETSGLQKALHDVQSGLDGVGNKAEETSRKTRTATEQMNSDWLKLLATFTAGNLIAGAVEQVISSLDKLQSKIDQSARYAARVETLGTAMYVTGNNAGYTSVQMDGYEKSVKQLGITTEATRESLAKMAASEIALAESSRLARVAQDAAVIGNINSSEAFGRMIQGIRSGEVEILRNIGISVQFEQGYKRVASQLGKNADQLTEQEKIQSRVNQVLAEGAKMQGAYEAAMGTTGKQLTSLPRYLDELELAFGKTFAPALGVLIEATTDKLKGLLKHFEENRGAYNELARNIADIVRATAHPIDSFVKFVNSPFDGPVSERTEIEEQNRLNTEAANKSLAEAKERQRIRLGEEARIAAQAETARLAREKEEKAARAKSAKEQAAFVKQYEDDILKESDNERKRRVKAQKDYAEAVEENMNRVVEAYRKEQQAAASASRLIIENQLAQIDTQERFYQLTAGEAAEKRIALLEESLALENSAYKAIKGNTSLEELERAKVLKVIQETNANLLEQQRILADQGAIGGARAALDEYARAAADTGSQTKGIVTDMFRGMEDAAVEYFRHQKLSFKEMIDSMISDLIRLQVRQQITGPAANMLNGKGADSGSWLGSLTGMFGSGSGSSVTGSAASGSSTLGSLGVYGAIASFVYSAASNYMSGLRKNHEGDAYNILHRSMPGRIFGGALDWATNGYLFGTKWNPTGGGMALGIGTDGVEGVNYIDQKRKGSWFRGNQYRTVTSSIDDLMMDYLNNQYAAVADNIRRGSRVLGQSGDLSGFTSSSRRVSLAGLDAKGQQDAIQTYFKSISTEAIEQLYPAIDKFAKLGEDATDTFQRLTSSLELVNRNLTLLDVGLNDISLDGAAAADVLVQTLGGLEQAAKAFSNYYSSGIFTDAEQQQLKLEAAQLDVMKTFSDLTLAIPRTNAEFQDLVRQQLALGDAGAEAAAALLQVAPAFATVTGSVQQMADAAAEASKEITATAKQTLTSSISTAADLLGTLKAMLSGPLAALSPEAAYFQAKQLFASADATSAAERGLAFAEASQRYNGSGAAFVTDRDAITAKLAQLAETAPNISAVDQQIQLLTEIRQAIETGDAAQAAALEVTFNAAQISMGLANNSLSSALTGIQATLNTPITAGTASAAMATQIATLQAALNNNGKPITGTAAMAINTGIAALQAAMNGTISPATAQSAIATSYALVQGALNGTISGTLAATATAAQYQVVQQAVNGTITAAAAQTKLASQYAIVQGALDGTISATAAETAIKSEYDAVTGALTSGVSGALTGVSDALADFNRSVTESAAATSRSLGNFVTAIELLQTYPTELTAFNSAASGLFTQYVSGQIDRSQYSSQYADNYSPVKADYDRGISAGLTTLTAPGQIDLTSADNIRMANKAASIISAIVTNPAYVNTGSIYPGQVGYNSQWDISWGVLGPDGRIGLDDVKMWKGIQARTVNWSDWMGGLPAFAAGSDGLDQDGPVYAHKYEKIIDPVSSQILSRYGIKISGSGDSKEVAEEIKALKVEVVRLNTALIRITQGGFAALVKEQQTGNKDLKTAASGAILDKRRANER